METFHDDQHGERRGKNKITILSAEGLRIAHFGDLGCPLTLEQTRLLQGLDAIMIPVGGHYTIDASMAKRICDTIHPTVIIPMHFKGKNFGFSVLAEVEEFTKLFDSNMIHRYDVNEINIHSRAKQEIALLMCPIQ